MIHSNFNRRQFVLGASAAALSSGRILGANDRLAVAVIGCGRRGLLNEAIKLQQEANIDIKAICDTWKLKRERAAAKVKEAGLPEPEQFVHYQDVLAHKGIDAVIIGTPDHQHCTMLTAAARAGKDVYVEKPLARNLGELWTAVDAVKKAQRVVQIGTQLRSWPYAVGIRDFLKAGRLGTILKIDQTRNSYLPYWMNYGGATFVGDKPAESDVDWKAFLMSRRPAPFDADKYQNWYGFREFSYGPHTNLMVHFIDLVHFMAGVNFPKRVMAMGGTYRWKNQYTCPDSIEVMMEYPEGFMVRYTSVFGTQSASTTLIGTRGTISGPNIAPDKSWVVSGEASREADKIAPGTELQPVETPHHMKNWFDCVRSRKEPQAPIEAGISHSVATLMAEESFSRGKRMVYDPAKRAIREG